MEKRNVATDVCIGMKGKYDINFNDKLDGILSYIYNIPNTHNADKYSIEVVLKEEKRYLDYLSEFEMIKIVTPYNSGVCKVRLERKGYEVFEKYKGWNDYKKKVIDKKHKVVAAKHLAQQFWWIPILISVLALVVSVLALIKK